MTKGSDKNFLMKTDTKFKSWGTSIKENDDL